MRSRRLILGLIILTLLATCLTAAAKLRATPKYDRVQVGMTEEEVEAILGQPNVLILNDEREARACWPLGWGLDEGSIYVQYERCPPGDTSDCKHRLSAKSLTKRGPLERLAWLAGWR